MSCVRHAVFGGSLIHGYGTPTSDLDIFLIVEGDEGRAFALGDSESHWDIEVRTVEWLDAFEKEIMARPHSILEAGYSGNHSDLRFALRSLVGQAIRRDDNIQAVFARIKERVEFWARVYISGSYINLYEDLVGLMLAGRLVELRLRIGDLALRALNVRMAQHRIIDLSSKPALSWLSIEASQSMLKRQWDDLLSLAFCAELTVPIAEALLYACNIIALGKVVESKPLSGEVNAGKISPALCFVCVPGYNVVQDVKSKSAFIYSDSFLGEYSSHASSCIRKQLASASFGK